MTVSLTGILAKDLKAKGLLPAKFNDLALPNKARDIGVCYRNTTIYTDLDVPAASSSAEYGSIKLLQPSGTDINQAFDLNSSSWSLETYVDLVGSLPETPKQGYAAINCVFTINNLTCNVAVCLAPKGSSTYYIIPEGPGRYGFKLCHEENNGILKIYKSFNGSDFSYVGTYADLNFTFTSNPNQCIALGSNYKSSLPVSHTLSGTKLIVNDEVLFYRV